MLGASVLNAALTCAGDGEPKACRPPRQVKQPGSAARSALPNQAANEVSAAFWRTREACPPERGGG